MTVSLIFHQSPLILFAFSSPLLLSPLLYLSLSLSSCIHLLHSLLYILTNTMSNEQNLPKVYSWEMSLSKDQICKSRLRTALLCLSNLMDLNETGSEHYICQLMSPLSFHLNSIYTAFSDVNFKDIDTHSYFINYIMENYSKRYGKKSDNLKSSINEYLACIKIQ